MNCHQLIAAILLINFSLIVARPQYDFGGAEVGESPAPPPKKELTKVSGDAHPEKAEENSFGGLIKSDTLQPASEPEPPGITTPTPIITPAAEENSVAPAITEPIPPTGDAEKAPESVTPVETNSAPEKVEQAPVVTDVPMAPDANLPPVAEIPKPDSEAQTETSIPEVITIASEKGETIVDSSPSGEKSGMEIEATSIAAEITAEPLVTETSAPVIEQQGETTAADIAPETSSESQTPAPAAENSVAPEAIASPEANSVAEPIPAKEEVSPAESDYTPPLPPAESTTIAAETAVSQDAPKEGISAPEIIEVSTIAQPKTEEASVAPDGYDVPVPSKEDSTSVVTELPAMVEETATIAMVSGNEIASIPETENSVTPESKIQAVPATESSAPIGNEISPVVESAVTPIASSPAPVEEKSAVEITVPPQPMPEAAETPKVEVETKVEVPASEIPATVDTTVIAEVSTEMPKAEEMPKIEEMPKVEETPKIEEMPKAEEMPKIEEMPKVEETPKIEEMPKVEEKVEENVPAILPETPQTSSETTLVPSVPESPVKDVTESTPSLPSSSELPPAPIASQPSGSGGYDEAPSAVAPEETSAPEIPAPAAEMPVVPETSMPSTEVEITTLAPTNEETSPLSNESAAPISVEETTQIAAAEITVANDIMPATEESVVSETLMPSAETTTPEVTNKIPPTPEEKPVPELVTPAPPSAEETTAAVTDTPKVEVETKVEIPASETPKIVDTKVIVEVSTEAPKVEEALPQTEKSVDTKPNTEKPLSSNEIVEPSGYNGNEPPSPQSSETNRVITPQEAVGYDGISTETKNASDGGSEQQDIAVETENKDLVNDEVSLRKIVDSSTKRKWKPYKMECENEKDDRGEFLCTEWARSGLCEAHRATMFLFCRKTCLCTGPPKDDDSSESDDATRRRRRRRRSAAALKSFKSHFKNYKIISA